MSWDMLTSASQIRPDPLAAQSPEVEGSGCGCGSAPAPVQTAAAVAGGDGGWPAPPPPPTVARDIVVSVGTRDWVTWALIVLGIGAAVWIWRQL